MRDEVVPYVQFLETLLSEGRAVVPPLEPLTAAERQEGAQLLARVEPLRRAECPSPVPAFHLSAAAWAAEQFCLACQFAIFRDVGEEEIGKAFAASFPDGITAETYYSVDLVFRFLPDLARFVSAASKEDPLANVLRHWARQWPLSSVGMHDVELPDVHLLIDHPGLMTMYIDRIVATGDKSRLEDQQVREHVLAAVGMYPELAPKLPLKNWLNENGEKV